MERAPSLLTRRGKSWGGFATPGQRGSRRIGVVVAFGHPTRPRWSMTRSPCRSSQSTCPKRAVHRPLARINGEGHSSSPVGFSDARAFAGGWGVSPSAGWCPLRCPFAPIAAVKRGREVAETPTWTVPREKMKAKDRQHDHTVYLGSTIANELRIWRQRTGGKGYVFKGNAGRDYIGREAVEKFYRGTLKLAGRMSPHRWRSALSTIAKDAGWASDVVELTLDHVHDSAVVRAYDRGERRSERIRLAEWRDAQLSSGPNDPGERSVLPFRTHCGVTDVA